jgi:hypothetical protein
MHGAEPVYPGRGPAAPADCGDQLSEDIETVFETAIGLRLQNAEQLGFAHACDDVVGDAPVCLGFLYASANNVRDGARARQQLRHVGSARR